jgi:hypothetical protein
MNRILIMCSFLVMFMASSVFALDAATWMKQPVQYQGGYAKAYLDGVRWLRPDTEPVDPRLKGPAEKQAWGLWFIGSCLDTKEISTDEMVVLMRNYVVHHPEIATQSAQFLAAQAIALACLPPGEGPLVIK